MSIHVCKCDRNGREEYHLRYPGWTEEDAQDLADKINAGWLRPPETKRDTVEGLAVSQNQKETP